MFSRKHLEAAASLIDLLYRADKKVAVAESCTGGMLGALLTSISGSSRVFLGGIVAYDNKIKERQLEIPRGLIRKHGAVSREVAAAMSANILHIMKSDFGVGITGITEASKSAGLVYVSICNEGSGPQTEEFHFTGDRENVRLQTLKKATEMLASALNG